MKLIIVESPTKAKTISKFLEKDFKVESSYGHIRDLPKSKLGIDVEKDFQPAYVIPTKSRKRVNELKKDVEKAKEIILATDEDREGEAIAWHLVQALGLNNLKSQNSNLKIKRIAFHEITKKAIEEALKNPREIDLNLVASQQARRILDRLVGYELSPFLWKKVFKGLSAGRVQSVAVRLIVDREREIQAFVPQEYWSIIASLKSKVKSMPRTETKFLVWGQKSKIFEAKLIKKDDKLFDKFAINNKQNADEILKDLKGAEYKVEKIEKKEVRRTPRPPFTTSTLQQEAANKLHFSAKQTMLLAQQLYENGFITYMRTDSVNLSEDSLKSAKEVINKNFGKEYSLAEARRFKTKTKGAQEAHEAIRPTQPKLTSQDLGGQAQLDKKHIQLYDLIWRRFMACQMEEAVFDSTTVDIKANEYIFRATGQVLKFDGWLKVYNGKIEETLLPELSEREILELIKLIPNQHFTEPPARYSEATLIKTLEEYGIGRPSTYAPTISTIQTRNYVEKNEQRKFIPTETGIIVNDLLVEHFPEVVDVGFTARIEEDLDKIAEGKIKWVPVIREFYEPFHKHLEEKYETVEKQKTDEETEEICEKCGKPMVIKRGRFGKFLACTGFPECRNTKSLNNQLLTTDNKEIIKCPKCNEGSVVVKRTKRKRIFYGCSRWPECDFASWQNPAQKEKTA